ncbi:hypothetical protein Sinac_0828 [Singulisphaera acidiphila DSM 18658]|uniref:Uncharacterized protein n=1 Tax=Singulisphaera acidiphila (strain ATCC BAA-1392 / DSM 18658 / VKM B-2454 / MOB10) TaxID=886293 RepID=L0D8P2_SINAD|nr:hypothetical protein Sinac_0828 [Singulisphaera acidiphila DSM 18658]
MPGQSGRLPLLVLVETDNSLLSYVDEQAMLRRIIVRAVVPRFEPPGVEGEFPGFHEITDPALNVGVPQG